VTVGPSLAGYFKGTPNGVWSHETTEALRQNQHANHLGVTGKLTDDELNKLKGASWKREASFFYSWLSTSCTLLASSS
jgi:hypothetical protein